MAEKMHFCLRIPSMVLLLLFFSGLAAENVLIPPLEIASGQCIHAEQPVNFTCIVANEPLAFTVWSGSIFNCSDVNDCSNNRITLLHFMYDTPRGTTGVCNTTVARSIAVVNDTYSSKLSFVASPELDGGTVECSISSVVSIGNSTLLIGVTPETPVMPSDPVNFTAMDFTISWQPPPNVDFVVGGVHYTIGTVVRNGLLGDCGTLTNLNETSALYSQWQANSQTCSYSVAAVSTRCNFSSDPIVIDIGFHVPPPPTITSVDIIFYQAESRVSVTISWNAVPETAPVVVIGDEIIVSGSIINYEVTFNNVSTAVECAESQCSFSNTSLDLSGTVLEVTLLANNALGPGHQNQKNEEIFTVTKDPSSNPLNVVLRCGRGLPCQLRYGASSNSLIYTGSPGVALDNLRENITYYYKALLSRGVFHIEVRGQFDTHGCSLSLLGKDDENATLLCRDLGYIGGVKQYTRMGKVCYNGTTMHSQAYIVCDGPKNTTTGNATCICEGTDNSKTCTWSRLPDNICSEDKQLTLGEIAAIGTISAVVAAAVFITFCVICACKCRKRSKCDSDDKEKEKIKGSNKN